MVIRHLQGYNNEQMFTVSLFNQEVSLDMISLLGESLTRRAK